MGQDGLLSNRSEFEKGGEVEKLNGLNEQIGDSVVLLLDNIDSDKKSGAIPQVGE